jgi:hypothetical protein
MRVLIVSKTHMRDMACVGGLRLDDNRNVRLLQSSGSNQPHDTPYEVGEIWDLNFRPKRDVVAPHIEDVFVDSGRQMGHERNMRSCLVSRIRPWQGGPAVLFDGMIRFTWNGTGYICRRSHLPSGSVGFWTPSGELSRFDQDGKTRYRCESEEKDVRITYVGFEPPVDLLSQGTLVRVSLARWWRPADAPDMEERCYLQLSGWYEVAAAAARVRAVEKQTGVVEDDIPF